MPKGRIIEIITVTIFFFLWDIYKIWIFFYLRKKKKEIKSDSLASEEPEPIDPKKLPFFDEIGNISNVMNILDIEGIFKL